MGIPFKSVIRFKRLHRLAYWLRQSVIKARQLDLAGWKISRQLREVETENDALAAETSYRRWRDRRYTPAAMKRLIERRAMRSKYPRSRSAAS